MNTQNRTTLTLIRTSAETQLTEADYLKIANSLTPDEQNGVVTQQVMSDDAAIALANNLSPEMQNKRYNDNASDVRKGRTSNIQARFKNKERDQQSIDVRNRKPKLETFETPAPHLDGETKRMDRETGGRFHGAGLLGRNRKRRQRRIDELEGNQQCEQPKVAVNENPFARWL